MTRTPPTGAATGVAALEEPTRPVAGVWVLWLSLISIGVWAGFFGPIQVLLAQQAEEFSPDHKEATLALVTGIGAAVSTVHLKVDPTTRLDGFTL